MADAQKAESTPSPDTEGAAVLDAQAKLTPEYLAMTPLQKWETLTLHGLLGTDEPWIADMRETLRTAQNTGRDEEIERAWKQGFCKGAASNFGPFPPKGWQVDAAWRKSKAFEALSSPPVSTVEEEGGGQ